LALRNPLHIYRSYSYKHILIVCDCTSTAEQLGKLDSNSFRKSLLIQPGVRDTPDDAMSTLVQGGDSGKYIVLINTLTDSNFYIKRASWQTFIVPRVTVDSDEADGLTSMAQEGEITIGEPRGIRFLNIINNASRVLNTGPTGLVWMLKTVFIGHTDTTPDYITDVKPFMFYMTNIVGKFDEGGGEYRISVLGQSNGASKAPHFSNISVPSITYGNVNSSARSESDSSPNTLPAVMTILNKSIQEVYDDNIKTAERLVLAQTGEELLGRKIKYVIELDSVYEKGYIVDNLQKTQQHDGTGGGVINFGRYPNIESMIRIVMTLCSRVNIDGSINGNESRKIFKIHSSVITNPDSVIVKYRIVQFPVAEVKFGDISSIIGGLSGGELLEFDYLYTGRNIDVLEFDINMEMGIAFFQLLESTPSSTDNQNMVGKHATAMVQPAGNGAVDQNVGEKNAPVLADKTQFSNMNILFPNADYGKVHKRNYKNYTSAVTFGSALAKHASLETLEAQIKIAGNPRLLNDFNNNPSDIGKLIPTSSDDQSVIPNWDLYPSLVKMNISMPSDASFSGTSGNFQQPFWYEGLYTIYSIRHTFENNGMFTQQMHLLSVPVRDEQVPDSPMVDASRVVYQDASRYSFSDGLNGGTLA